MTIGDFSRATRLSAKALRFYHRAGLLSPAVVDERNGYRLYAPEQIADAQIVRTLRGLDVPVDEIRTVLSTADVAERSSLLTAHLDRLEERLAATAASVASLRALLDPPTAPLRITHRRVPEMEVIAVRATIALPALNPWFRGAVAALQAIASDLDEGAVASFGGVWSDELFAGEHGDALVYVALADGRAAPRLPKAATVQVLPAVELAVAVHDGPDHQVPRVYAALGAHVARHELRTDAPVRETYVSGFPGIDRRTVTEIGWPVFRVSR